ncbi:pseudouridylate synthase 1 homolog [Macrosteles quadrilineatus]|uniref:pseudouridylate synthase 1 homolog n=1 Tax=Macrosteles quadrilineatus TaxID=74068 RepID=UPI0023E31E9F|nr:pseudouridylate synthase 1 homolog [Macrosteles quadrilineatus]
MLSFLNITNSCKRNIFCQFPRRISKQDMSVTTTDSNLQSRPNNLKREASEIGSESNNETCEKKPLLSNVVKIKRRKVALLISYLGQGYLGLQRNPGTKTIEEDLLSALLKAGYINEEVFNEPQLISFQRAARTDKGVSAIRQVLSLKLPETSSVEEINKHLPEQIRAIAIQRVTKGFNCKGNCDGRTYSYTTPTFAFSQQGEEIHQDFRLPNETREHIEKVLKMYVGTHNYHNFTSKRLPTDPSSNRYIMNFSCGDPFVKEDLEFVTLKVKGQSFMLHQIRKMVGLLIAIVRGMTASETLVRSWEREKLDIPIAPGLGLLLEEVHYDRYNQRYGSDGVHEPIDWSKWNPKIDEFKDKFIMPTIVTTEKNEKSMLTWLDSLSLHSFDVRTVHIQSDLDKALERNKDLLVPPSNIDALLAAAHAVEAASSR